MVAREKEGEKEAMVMRSSTAKTCRTNKYFCYMHTERSIVPTNRKRETIYEEKQERIEEIMEAKEKAQQ